MVQLLKLFIKFTSELLTAACKTPKIYIKPELFQSKPSTDITIAAWIKIGNTAGEHSIFYEEGSDGASKINFEVNDGKLRWQHKNVMDELLFEIKDIAVSQGVWTHVAGSCDSSNKEAKVFVDGKEKGSAAISNVITFTFDHRIIIGRLSNGERELNGKIDEFRIYDHAVSDTDIDRLYTD